MKAGSYAVFKVGATYHYGHIKSRKDYELTMRSNTDRGLIDGLSIAAKHIIFQLTREQYLAARKEGWPQTSEAVMRIVNWSKGGKA